MSCDNGVHLALRMLLYEMFCADPRLTGRRGTRTGDRDDLAWRIYFLVVAMLSCWLDPARAFAINGLKRSIWLVQTQVVYRNLAKPRECPHWALNKRRTRSEVGYLKRAA